MTGHHRCIETLCRSILDGSVTPSGELAKFLARHILREAATTIPAPAESSARRNRHLRLVTK